MKRTMMATALSTALLFTGTLKAAKADMPRPSGAARSMAAKHADACTRGTADHASATSVSRTSRYSADDPQYE